MELRDVEREKRIEQSKYLKQTGQKSNSKSRHYKSDMHMANKSQQIKRKILAVACICLSVSLVFTQRINSSLYVYAHDVVSRFPGDLADNEEDDSNDDSDNDSEDNEEEETTNWVDIKDDWRHGITHEESSKKKKNKRSGKGKGNAEGDHAVELSDGSYYWFCQNTSAACTCASTYSADGSINIQKIYWGAGGGALSSNFGRAACAQYSLAMIASNLLGQCITLDESMLAFGDNFNDAMTIYDVNGTDGAIRNFGTYGDTNPLTAPKIFADYWGLQCTETYGSGHGSEATRQMAEEVLDKGGMIWYNYASGGVNPNGGWPYSRTGGHFICIRGYDEEGFYLLDSALNGCLQSDENNIAKTDTPVSWDTIWQYGLSSATGGVYVGFWVDGDSSSNNSKDNENNSKDDEDEDKKSKKKSDDEETSGIDSISDEDEETTKATKKKKEDSSEEETTESSDTDSISEDDSEDASESETTYSCEWYGPGDVIDKYTETIDLGNDYYLYNGLPWASDASTYTVDTDTMLGDMYDYVVSVSDNTKALKGNGEEVTMSKILASGTRMRSTSSDAISWDNWKDDTEGKGKYIEIDGLKAVGVSTVPSVLDKDYCVKYENINWAKEVKARDSLYSYGTKKMAVALYERATKKIWYLPVTNCRAKEDTFPGGVAQTNLSIQDASGKNLEQVIDGNSLKEYKVWKSGYSAGLLDKMLGSISEGKIETLMDTMNTEMLTGASIWEVSMNIADFYNIPNNLKDILSEDSDYDVVGYVIWDK